MSLFSWLSRGAVDEADIRMEIWRLGTRYFGEPLAGALSELKMADLQPDRAMLLHACVRRLTAAEPKR